MKINQLQYAVTVWKRKSFSKAASKFKISQSAISQQITKLEDEMNFLIFDRLSQHLKPTKKGLLFLEESQQLLLQFSKLKDFGNNLDKDYEGSLNVGIIPTLSSYLVSLFINDFNKKNPKVSLSIFELQTNEILNGLLDRSLDTGIIATPIKSSIKYKSDVLFYENFFVYSAEDYPFYLQENVIIDETCYNDIWVLQEGNCFANQVVNICSFSKKFKQNLKYSCNSIESLRRIVDQQGGFTFIPELATIDISSEEENKIKKIDGPNYAREISMIHLKNEPKLSLIKMVQKSIRINLPKTMLNKKHKKIVPTNVIF